MMDNIDIKQIPSKTNCAWHKKYQETGKIYKLDEIFPNKVCPILYHTLYPYFLGLLFGAKYVYNEDGDCNVCCPAEKGVDTIVKMRPYNNKFNEEVPINWRDTIYAEIIKVHGKCDYKYKVGDRIMFPTYSKIKYICPAGLNNIFPFLDIEIPKCINLKKLRCPDWLENIYYNIK